MFIASVRDVIAEPRYDTVGIPAAGSTLLTFFAVPIGQGTTVWRGGGAKSLADTNMELAGQLPNPYTFTVLGIRLALPNVIVVGDFLTCLTAAAFQLTIGAKPFLRVPARTIPAGNGPFGTSNVAASTILSNGYPSMQNGFGIGRKPLVLSPTENFQASLAWTALEVNTTVVAGGFAGIAVTCYLDGFLKRGAQ